MPLTDDSLCGQTANAGEVNRSTGACCHIATVDNVNLLTGELTVTFVATPPEPFSAQVIIPGANVRYNCGLCYTGGLGTNLPAFGFERDDSVLVLIPRGWVPKGEFDTQGLFVVGHEFANGVENQKACGQMGRMIIKPGEDSAGTNGYGAPFLEEVVVDEVATCVPVNPFFDPYLGVEVGQGTLNGAGRHLMVYGNGEDLVAVRPYLFPAGASYGGSLEKNHQINDGLFPFGLRQLTTFFADSYAGYANVTFTTKLQKPRAIGTDTASYTGYFVLTISSTGQATYSGSNGYACQPYAATEAGLYVRTSEGMVLYNVTVDADIPSVAYSTSDKTIIFADGGITSEIFGYDYEYSLYVASQGDIYGNAGADTYNMTASATVRPVHQEMTVLHDGINTVRFVYDFSEQCAITGFEFYDSRHTATDGYSATTESSSSSILSIQFNGNELCKIGRVFSYTDDYIMTPEYDGSDICSASPGAPPSTPEVALSFKKTGSCSFYNALFLYMDVQAGIALYITCEWSDSITNEPANTVIQPTATLKINLWNNGGVTVLDELEYDTGEEVTHNVTPSIQNGPLYNNDFNVIVYPPSAYAWSYLGHPAFLYDGGSWTYEESVHKYDTGVTWFDGSLYQCTWTDKQIEGYNTVSISPVATMGGVWDFWTFPPHMSIFQSYTGRRDAVSQLHFLTNYFNEFAKSDDGQMLYFSGRKLSAIPAMSNGDDDYIRVLINNGSVSTDAKTVLEAATGLTHSQTGLRFAPV